MTVQNAPAWPEGDSGRVLLHLVAQCSVDTLFEDFFGSYPELSAKLHKQRNDSNCAESPWVSKRGELPQQQFTWPAPPAGADPGTAGQGKCRKVRFDAAASLASKAFTSEEIQTVQEYAPGSHYLVQSEVYTTAMYGDQFCMLSRYSLVAKGPNQTLLHVAFAIDFKSSLSRLMKPMVAKGVDAGVRGSFGMLKKLLPEQYSITDLPESAPAPQLPGAGEAAAPAAGPAAAMPVPAAPPAMPAAAGPAGLYSLAEYVVYQDLVSGILSMSNPQLTAKALAFCLTLVVIHILITVLRPLTSLCAGSSIGDGGGLRPLLGLICWPFGLVLDFPDSLLEVVGSMLLVLVANRLLMAVVKAAASSVSTPRSVASSNTAPQGTAAAQHTEATSSTTGAPPAADAAANTAVNGHVFRRRGAGSNAGKKQQSGHDSTPVANPNRRNAADNSSFAGGSGSVGSGADGMGPMQNIGNVINNWGRNLLGANVVNTLSSNEGLKAFMIGNWQKAGSDVGRGTTAGATDSSSSTSTSTAGEPTPARALSHRRTMSFTAVMDPSGLHIIEDYAGTEPMPRVAEETSTPPTPVAQSIAATPKSATVHKETAASSTVAGAAAAGTPQPGTPQEAAAASPATTAVAVAATPTAAVPSGLSPLSPGGKAVAGGGEGSGSTALHEGSPAAGTTAAVAGSSPARGTPSPSSNRTSSPSQPAAHRLAAAAGSQQQLLNAVNDSSSRAGNGSKAASQPATPAETTAADLQHKTDEAGSTRAGSPKATGSPNRPRAAGKAVSFLQSPTAAVERGTGSFTSGHNAGGSSGKGAFASLARRSASPGMALADPLGGSGSSGVALRAKSSREFRDSGSEGWGPDYEQQASQAPYVVPGEEDEDEVTVEVFEHERVQPFRGWGHTWPGHFLPSDRVGHWGDRTGAPGGAMSMLFEQVAPQLPDKWAWRDAEWQVDKTGEEIEGCDADGWSYGMDFSWLLWPPAPQSGKAGIKSFVRRRRWIRTRMRLPAGNYGEAKVASAATRQQQMQQEGQQGQSKQQRPSAQPDEPDPAASSSSSGSSSGANSSSVGSSSAAAAKSAGTSEGGLVAGWGTGFGLVGPDGGAAAAATAAATAASGFMNKLIRAVSDLPSPMGSNGGVPPQSPSAATGNKYSPGPSQHGPTTSRSPLGVLIETPLDGDGASSTSSDSNDDRSSDSSSVDSGPPPPRQAYTEAAALERQGGQANAKPQETPTAPEEASGKGVSNAGHTAAGESAIAAASQPEAPVTHLALRGHVGQIGTSAKKQQVEGADCAAAAVIDSGASTAMVAGADAPAAQVVGQQTVEISTEGHGRNRKAGSLWKEEHQMPAKQDKLNTAENEPSADAEAKHAPRAQASTTASPAQPGEQSKPQTTNKHTVTATAAEGGSNNSIGSNKQQQQQVVQSMADVPRTESSQIVTGSTGHGAPRSHAGNNSSSATRSGAGGNAARAAAGADSTAATSTSAAGVFAGAADAEDQQRLHQSSGGSEAPGAEGDKLAVSSASTTDDWEWSSAAAGTSRNTSQQSPGAMSGLYCSSKSTADAKAALAAQARPGSSYDSPFVAKVCSDYQGPAAAHPDQVAAALAAPASAVIDAGSPAVTLAGSIRTVDSSGGSSELPVSLSAPVSHSPRIGAGRGSTMRSRSSSAGGSRGNRPKLGAVSLRQSGEGALRSTGAEGVTTAPRDSSGNGASAMEARMSAPAAMPAAASATATSSAGGANAAGASTIPAQEKKELKQTSLPPQQQQQQNQHVEVGSPVSSGKFEGAAGKHVSGVGTAANSKGGNQGTMVTGSVSAREAAHCVQEVQQQRQQQVEAAGASSMPQAPTASDQLGRFSIKP